jgi:hypothetical protein
MNEGDTVKILYGVAIDPVTGDRDAAFVAQLPK